MSKDKIDDNTIVLDLGDTTYTGSTYDLSSTGIDTITIDPSWNMGSITIPTTTTTTVYSPSTYTISGTNGYNWSNVGTSPTVKISDTGMEIKEGGDVKIGEVSLKDFIQKMEQRLSILIPDPEKLEKFEALKKAYEHYKTMEALCFPAEEKKEK